MSDTSSSSTHLSNPVTDTGRVTLESAIQAYKTWSRNSGAYVETDDQSITHKGFEELLSEMRDSGVDIGSIVLSRLVERFNTIDSHILNENEVRNLIKRYPQVAFDDDWEALDTETVDDVDLLLTGTDSEGESKSERVMLVEIAFETDSRKALGTLLCERERLGKFSDSVEMCLVTLDSDEYFRRACESAGVRHLELGPTSLIRRVEECPEWGNLRGFTLSP